MVYKSFDELNAKYPSRDEMSFEEELEYVRDAFDTYENLGFRNIDKDSCDFSRVRNWILLSNILIPEQTLPDFHP